MLALLWAPAGPERRLAGTALSESASMKSLTMNSLLYALVSPRNRPHAHTKSGYVTEKVSRLNVGAPRAKRVRPEPPVPSVPGGGIFNGFQLRWQPITGVLADGLPCARLSPNRNAVFARVMSLRTFPGSHLSFFRLIFHLCTIGNVQVGQKSDSRGQRAFIN